MPTDDYIKRSDAIAKLSELPFLDEELDIPPSLRERLKGKKRK